MHIGHIQKVGKVNVLIFLAQSPKMGWKPVTPHGYMLVEIVFSTGKSILLTKHKFSPASVLLKNDKNASIDCIQLRQRFLFPN